MEKAAKSEKRNSIGTVVHKRKSLHSNIEEHNHGIKWCRNSMFRAFPAAEIDFTQLPAVEKHL